MNRNAIKVFALALVASLQVSGTAMSQDADLLAILQTPGHFGLMRHATAPGSDDPPGFRLGECATQRNLSPGGRERAAQIGRRLAAGGIRRARVFSSQWCRCMDTARLLDLGDVEPLSDLNSLVSYPRQGGEMTRNLRARLLDLPLDEPTLLVTHQVNIGALLRGYPEEGEIVVVERQASGELAVIGTIAAD